MTIATTAASFTRAVRPGTPWMQCRRPEFPANREIDREFSGASREFVGDSRELFRSLAWPCASDGDGGKWPICATQLFGSKMEGMGLEPHGL